MIYGRGATGYGWDPGRGVGRTARTIPDILLAAASTTVTSPTTTSFAEIFFNPPAIMPFVMMVQTTGSCKNRTMEPDSGMVWQQSGRIVLLSSNVLNEVLRLGRRDLW